MSEPHDSQPKPSKAHPLLIPVEDTSEQVILSLMLQFPDQAISRAQRALTADDFFSGNRRIVFNAVCDLYNGREPVTAHTAYNRVNQMGLIPDDEGRVLLAELATFTTMRDFASSMHEFDWHLQKLLEASRRRHVLQTAKILSDAAKDGDVDLDAAAGQLLALAKARPAIASTGPRHIRDFLHQAVEMMEQAARGENAGWQTRHAALDNILGGGLRPNSYVVIAARPSLGKTSLAMDILWRIAEQQVPVTAISLETKGWNLSQRLMANVAGIPFGKIRAGKLSRADLDHLMFHQNRINLSTMRLSDPGTLDCNQLRNEVRKEVTDYGTSVFMLDYLQLIRNSIKGNDKEYDRVTEVSQTLKELTQEYPIAVLAVCQLKRNDNKAPTMEDLRSSGQIEQDATEILLLSNADDASDEDENVNLCVRVAKQKDGARGEVTLRFHRSTFSFSNCTTCP